MSRTCRCGRELFGEIELEVGICGRCADVEIEREQQRREWEYFHPSERKEKKR